MAKDPKSKNITWSGGEVDHAARVQRNGHKAAILWFTGLSGSGKSTMARSVEKELFLRRCHTYILGGDDVRAVWQDRGGYSIGQITQDGALSGRRHSHLGIQL